MPTLPALPAGNPGPTLRVNLISGWCFVVPPPLRLSPKHALDWSRRRRAWRKLSNSDQHLRENQRPTCARDYHRPLIRIQVGVQQRQRPRKSLIQDNAEIRKTMDQHIQPIDPGKHVTVTSLTLQQPNNHLKYIVSSISTVRPL